MLAPTPLFGADVFTPTDRDELRGFVEGMYTDDCCRRSLHHWEAAIAAFLRESEGIDPRTADRVAPAVLALLGELRDGITTL
jgi:hypothetical protein